MRKRIIVAAMLCLSGLGFAGSAQSNRFTGNWTLLTNAGVVWNVEQSDAGVKVTILSQGKQIRSTEWLFNGAPVSLLVSNMPAQTTASFDGQVLIFAGPIALKDASVPATVEETWKLSQEGDELIVETKIASAATNFNRQQVFRRQK